MINLVSRNQQLCGLDETLCLCAHDVVELLVDAHELLDCVDVDASVLGVHAGDALLGAVALGDVDDVDEVPQHRVEPRARAPRHVASEDLQEIIFVSNFPVSDLAFLRCVSSGAAAASCTAYRQVCDVAAMTFDSNVIF